MTFGEKIRRLRKEKGWTQAEPAKLSGLSLRTIISYEKGESYPKKRSTYDVLAEIFEIPSVELRSETDELDFQNPAGNSGKYDGGYSYIQRSRSFR